MEDNDYLVRLDPLAFEAVYAEIEAALAWEKDTDARQRSGLQRAFKALQEADRTHSCVDETR